MRTTLRHNAWQLLFACWAVLLLVSGSAKAADPIVNFAVPPGAQRGIETEISLRGARLGDAQEILFYEPGIEVKSLEAKPNEVKVKLAIAPDCRLGRHALRVRTATGVSLLRTLFVGAMKEIAEKEPNSLFETPQAIELDTTINGLVKTEDVDYYQVIAKKGERISVEIEGLRLGRFFFDPQISILNAKRFELAAADDSPLLRQDAHLSILAPEDGKYIIQVRESAYQGNDNCTYRLHVGRFPRPTVAMPAGGRPGETLNVQFIGDPSGVQTESITLPTKAPRNFGLFRQEPTGISPSPVAFRVNHLKNFMEAEPNNNPKQASPVEAPGAMNGVIGAAGDVDHIKFHAKKGQVFDIRVHARGIRSPLDPAMGIARANGANGAYNDDTGGPDSYLRYTVPEDDDYVIRVRDHLRKGGPDYVYRVEIVPVRPSVTMDLPEWDRYVAMSASVPQGNRMAFLVNAARRDFGGDLRVSLEGLPAKVGMQTTKMVANPSQVPVLLSAEADAPLAGALVEVLGRPVDPIVELVGRLNQRTWLIRGANNVDVWNHYADRMAVAVTQPAPFKIEIVQPKVPLLQSGQMNLKVVAHRNEGFKGAIALRMLYNPSGVSSSGSIQIPPDKSEAKIPLTASGNAQLRSWKIAVIGQSNVNGTMRVSSQLADLQVAAPLLAFEFPKAVVEQGKATDFVVKVKHNSKLPGVAIAELLGLPGGATTTPMQITNDTTELKFHIETTPKSRAGRHKAILCRTVVTDKQEPMIHTMGTGELRIDAPPPPPKPVSQPNQNPKKKQTAPPTPVAKAKK